MLRLCVTMKIPSYVIRNHSLYYLWCRKIAMTCHNTPLKPTLNHAYYLQFHDTNTKVSPHQLYTRNTYDLGAFWST